MVNRSIKERSWADSISQQVKVLGENRKKKLKTNKKLSLIPGFHSRKTGSAQKIVLYPPHTYGTLCVYTHRTTQEERTREDYGCDVNIYNQTLGR